MLCGVVAASRSSRRLTGLHFQTETLLSLCRFSQARTSGCGLSRMNSETTLVSRTIITVGSIEPGRFPHRFPWRNIQFDAAERLEQLVEGRAEVLYRGFLLPERCLQDDVGLLLYRAAMLSRRRRRRCCRRSSRLRTVIVAMPAPPSVRLLHRTTPAPPALGRQGAASVEALVRSGQCKSISYARLFFMCWRSCLLTD